MRTPVTSIFASPFAFVRALCGVLLLIACHLVALADQPANGNWPGWRGDGSGVSLEKNLPAVWDATENVVWKTALPGEGNSSPIIWNSRIFLTVSQEKGAKRQILCLDEKTGQILWQREFLVEKPAPTYEKNQYASSTMVTDGERLYAFFDDPGLIALDMEGKVLWTCALGPFVTPWNLASSPVLCQDIVAITCDQNKDSFIAGVDKKTGEVRWKTPRKGGRQFATPFVLKVNDAWQIVENGDPIVAYDSATGEVIWTCKGMISGVVPSIVAGNGFVYATSGRNGPTLAIDPSGKGDVTETHVKMQRATHGPYVASPLLFNYLFLPGDDGYLRGIDGKGELAVSGRAPGQYSASPVAGDGKIYWANERGDVYVFDAMKLSETPPSLPLLSVNKMGEKILASPAIANGRIFVRTAKNLYCIAGAGGVAAPVTVQETTQALPFDDLKANYTAHFAPEGDDILLRLDIVDMLEKSTDPRAIPFLQEIALTDNHWNVSEAAVKALVKIGQPAEAAMIETFTKSKAWMTYLKIIPADGLGAIKSTAAVPVLLASVKVNDRLVRMACLRNLAIIAQAHDAEVVNVLPALIAALQDKEGAVRVVAIDAVATFPDRLGDKYPEVLALMRKYTEDTNPLVAESARKTLPILENAQPVKDTTQLFGEQRKASVVEYLQAGPVRMKFQDGELRYLRVGEKEIVRRVYLAVRDSRWDTVMPEFSKVEIKKENDSFKITLEALCKNDVAEYRWNGEITGAADGTITFNVTGEPLIDFSTPRVGLCVLYGAESLAGQSYESESANGTVTASIFPKDVSPNMLAPDLRRLSYNTPEGLQFSMTLEGGKMGMEDQRNFGDSSYKAFGSMAYKTRIIPKGDVQSQKLVFTIAGAQPVASTAKPLTIAIGGPIEGARMPALTTLAEAVKADAYVQLNKKRPADLPEIAWVYNPAAHLPDDDTFMENPSSIIDQARTVRSYAPTAKLRVVSIGFNSPYLRPSPDSRNAGLFAASWTALVTKYLAQAGVDEASFIVGGKSVPLAVDLFAPYTGGQVLATEINAPYPSAVEALAVRHERGTVVWVMNKTAEPQQVSLIGFGVDGERIVTRISAQTPDGIQTVKETLAVKDGAVDIALGAFEVWRIE